MQKLNIFRLLLSLLCISCFQSVAAGKITLHGHIYDRATDTEVFTATVKLLNAADSTVVEETKAVGEFSGPVKGELVRKSIFYFFDVDKSKKYLLELSRENYEPLLIHFDPEAHSGRTDDVNLGKIYMKRQPVTLDDVVVKASKVMFYNKGDTLIYNADAFVLAEGSMLDALIRQMPGVELREGGEIYVNGKYVENLLLNGKDFFKGNRQMMLDNLGAYTVKNIAVYERQDDMDKIMGKDYGEKHLSMDVLLKKEYNQGLLTNIEAGYGTSDRYLGRLFGMWYSDNARLSLYGNANNLSDNRKPGQNTSFNPGSMQSGDFKTYQGGFDYWAKIPYKNISFYGDVFVTHQSIEDDRSTYITNFLPGGDTYGYSFQHAKNKYLTINTSHSLDVQKEKWNFKVNPKFKYTKNNDLSEMTSATFTQSQKEIGKEFLDNLYKSASADVLASILNKYNDDNKRLGHSLDASLSGNGKIKMPNNVDALTYLVSGDYRRHHDDRFQRYVLNIGSSPVPTDYYDRYFDNTPYYQWQAKGALGYIWAIRPGMYLDAWYQYDYSYVHEVSDLYRLETLMDGTSDGKLLGWLPSKTEYESSIDLSNSFNSRKRDNNHSANFKLTWEPIRILSFRLNLPLVYRNQWLHYIRGNVNTAFSRNRFFVGDASFDFAYYGRPHYVYFEYRRRNSSPDLVDMVDFRDALDPLNVRLGNPCLKDSESHQFSASYRYDGKIAQRYAIDASFLRNALAYGYNYDSVTGVKTGMMYNVNGNYNIGAYQSLFMNFGSGDRFNFNNTTDLRYRRSVDLLSEDSPVPEKNKVSNPSIRESVELSYKFLGSRIAVFGEASVSRFISKQRNFHNFTANDIKYGLTGNFALPAGFGLSTDFTIYTRRGYSDAMLNKTNFVWNARATYTVLKG